MEEIKGGEGKGRRTKAGIYFQKKNEDVNIGRRSRINKMKRKK